MKKIFVFFTLVLLSINSFSQWQWAKQIGGPNYDGGGTLIDSNDNMYCAGIFHGSCYFDNDTLYSVGTNDVFLAKYDASHNELWAKRFGGNNPINHDEWTGGTIIDNVNNCIYFSGTFYGSLLIDVFSLSASGNLDIFLAKFDFNGNCLWLKKAGSFPDDSPGTININSTGNIYWTGVLGGNGNLDSYSLNKGTFLAELDTSGNVIWARNEMTGGYPSKIKIVNDVLYFCGITTNDTTVIDTITLLGSNYVDCLIGKLDTAGNVFWAKRFGGNSTDYGIDLEMDANMNLYNVGQFQDSLIVGGDTLTNNHKADMYFAKFDSSGNLIWIKQSHADGYFGALGKAIIKDADGAFYTAGYFGGNASFGSFNVASAVSNSKDLFVAKYDTGGSCIGLIHCGEAEANGVQLDNSGSLIVSGDFVNTATFGSTSLTFYGVQDMFFAKSDAITGGIGGERPINNQLVIYANPNAGKCNITIPEEFLHEKKLTLSIFNNEGKLIQEKTLEMHEGKIKINLEAEAKGVYNVILSDGKKSYGGKIVFE